MTLVRQLGPMEKEFLRQAILGHADFCSVFFVEGSWNVAEFPKALGRLRIPLLHARIQDDRILYDGLRPLPYRILPRRDDEHWRRVAEEEICRSEAALASFTVLIGDERSEILIRLSHASFDGLSGMALGKALVRALNGETVTEDLGPSMLDCFPKAFRGASALDDARALARSERALAPANPLRFGDGPPTYSTESAGIEFRETRVLQRLAKERDANLFSAVAAASLRAATTCFATSDERVAGLTTPINLRPFLKPEIDANELGVYMSFLVAWHDVSQDPWTLAAKIHAGLGEGVNGGEGFLRSLLCGLNEVDMPRPSISISNMGVIEDFESIGNARITGVRSLVALWTTDPVSLVLQTYQNRLLIDIHCSRDKLGSGAAAKMASELRLELLRYTDS